MVTCFVLNKIGAGKAIYSLRQKIQDIQAELNQLGNPVSEIPEMIESTNLLRLNEYLVKSNEKKTELLSVYEQYSEALETLLSSVFEIQNELKEILKEQSSMLSKTPKTKKSAKTKSKIKK